MPCHELQAWLASFVNTMGVKNDTWKRHVAFPPSYKRCPENCGARKQPATADLPGLSITANTELIACSFFFEYFPAPINFSFLIPISKMRFISSDFVISVSSCLLLLYKINRQLSNFALVTRVTAKMRSHF